MRIAIEHETYYGFNRPAQYSIQYLRLTPRADGSQIVQQWSLNTAGRLTAWTDGFGNLTHVSVQEGTHSETPVIVRGVVETIDTAGVVPADDGLPPVMFLRESRFTHVDDAIRALALPIAERAEDEGPIAALHALMMTIHEALSYRPGSTHVETGAAEALAQGVGVCQDHAHLFIAGCRVLGVPARYVSGYLLPSEGESVATHAWAEAFVDDLGWISFDAANNVSATEAYVRLAVAADYAGAAPIRGMRSGGGEENMSVRVNVLKDGQ